MRVAGIAGSLREGSLNKGLLRAAVELAPPGMEIVIYTRLGDIPPYNDDVFTKGDPEPVADLKTFIDAVDALLISTPEYNYGVPGVLKNAIDWASRPFPDNVLRGKPVAVVGASTGLFGAVWAQAELRKVLHHAGADALEEELPVGLADYAFAPTGELADLELQQRLVELVDALAREVRTPLAVSR
jgi:chromate reductase, NAD(P)H dehydrogenase (quinone)